MNSEEVEALGAGFVNLFSDPEMSKAYFDMLSKIGEAANEAAEKKKDPDPEEDEDEEEDDADYEEERDRLIRELRDLGCEVHKVDEGEDDGLIECYTYDHRSYGTTKFKFVKSWLKTKNIEFKEKTVCGDLRITYKLTGSDLAALQQYLKDNKIIGSEVVV